jgi:hypothetical protein
MVACSPRPYSRHRRYPFVRAVFIAVLLTGFTPASAFAQLSESKHWGVAVSFTPKWEAMDRFHDVFVEEEGSSIEGTEFTIGIARGSMRGGDWGVSFVRKPFKDGLTFSETTSDCDPAFGCFINTRTLVFRKVYLRGVEYHWSKPVVTFADRVQIGVNISAGAGFVEGDIEETFDLAAPPPAPGHRDTVVGPAKDTLWPVYPLVKAEAQGSVVVAPGLKVQVSGGFNFPGIAARVSAVYLIGAR